MLPTQQVLLLRLDPEGFDPETKDRTTDGIAAYSDRSAYWLRRHQPAP
jgi:hypothetical protein